MKTISNYFHSRRNRYMADISAVHLPKAARVHWGVILGTLTRTCTILITHHYLAKFREKDSREGQTRPDYGSRGHVAAGNETWLPLSRE